jgi:hypothetical protein
MVRPKRCFVAGERPFAQEDPVSPTPPRFPVIRVSLGWYPAEKADALATILDYAGKPLGDAIQKLPGLLAYYSGIDRTRNALVNVSLWKDVPSADQMSTLQAMLDQAEVLTKLGVQFVRPITNFDTVWSA